MQRDATGAGQDQAGELALGLGQQRALWLVAAQIVQQAAPVGAEDRGIEPRDGIEIARRLQRADRDRAAGGPGDVRLLGAQPLQTADRGEAERAIDRGAVGRGVEAGDQAALAAALDRPAQIVGGEAAPPEVRAWSAPSRSRRAARHRAAAARSRPAGHRR